ncbi:hypothetical protein ROLI_007690 [Roseobacter fucihabitans]|uniref:Zinc finger/thioredoxin putative domain-containing protein n=1 Tax=Roseobacter fucihabitans TaxID=1537242 RepID=A0ABZ2BPR8_9RHOB|nr:zinc-ribbon domain-containing protein [Roseobacter litoralis]MBC6966063.1 hypothetical protein [Roseobacter litoralis]
MRLICPNCDAQYEIPDDTLLPDGRDVQCSNCEHTWFQEHPDAQAAPTPPATKLPGRPVTEPDKKAEAVSDVGHAGDPPMPGRKPLDAAVANVLREEAQLEAQARQKEASVPVETQPDLGLKDTQGDTSREAAPGREVPAPSPDKTALAAVGSGGAPLPDVNQINSTMRSNSDRSPKEDAGQTAQIETRARRSFGRGFTMMVVLAAGLVLLYAMAPQVANAIPETAPWIDAYIATVDQARLWLDARIAGFLMWLDTVTAA